ncbi:MAG: TRAP transporter small permease [Alphaproteobacteria bacterium]
MAADTTPSRVRRALDGLYFGGGVVAACTLLIMLGLIVAQMVARWTGIVLPGSTNYAGYAMAATSFFAMAYALNKGAHIRVSLFLTHLGKWRRFGELWCFGIASALAWYFVYFAYRAAYWSYKLNDVSQGQDATPLWIPQLPMAMGMTIFAIALSDNLVRVFLFGTDGIDAELLSDEHTE